MRNKLKDKLKAALGLNQWEVRRTIWPYSDGYGTYNPGTRTVLDTGLSKEEAQKRCDQLNQNNN